ncbi:MAG: carboxylating nicotinate-nucleotide diphosphorylase [Thermoleophilaceae bacterium]|nr:carboxylating nicotinate-nucleotide diphosphorylase [Thermoleophilaceae bacterium]
MRELIEQALAEDIGAGDITSRAVVPEGARAGATIFQKAPGVVAGLDVAEAVFEGLHCERTGPEGEWREQGPVAAIEGNARELLSRERVALNFLGHLSGIATLTARYVRAVEGTGAIILDTRKTTPGLRALEKEAVRMGGAHSHRDGLFDAILVKENHAAIAGGVLHAAELALANAPAGVLVEVEVASIEELELALAAGVPRILLDNMAPATLREAVEMNAGRAKLEASGGITLANVRAVAETGVGLISIGALTHSAPALDLSLTCTPTST